MHTKNQNKLNCTNQKDKLPPWYKSRQIPPCTNLLQLTLNFERENIAVGDIKELTLMMEDYVFGVICVSTAASLYFILACILIVSSFLPEEPDSENEIA